MSCSVFWMQKLRGSASRPVELVSVSAQDEKAHWLRQPMQSAWSLRISCFSAGVTNTRVLSGVLSASVEAGAEPLPRAQQVIARHPEILPFTPTSSWKVWSPRFLGREGNLPFGA